jgi:hypothetical protein
MSLEPARLRTRVLRVLGLWLALSLAWGFFGWHRVNGELLNGAMTDHISHVNRTRAFFHLGPAIWSTPTQEWVEQARAPLPDGYINWDEVPTLYPVGMLVLHAPFALLAERGALTVERLGFFVILLYLLAFSAVAEFLFVNARQRGLVDALVLFGYALALLGFVLRGFYDVWPLLLLLHAFKAGADRRPGAALLWWAAAACLHYRVFFTFPAALQWAWALRGDRAAAPRVALAAALGTSSLATFLLSAPFLSRLPENNPLHQPQTLGLVVLALFAFVGWKLRTRRWAEIVLACGVVLSSVAARQIMPWHSFIPLAAMISQDATERWPERYARYAFYFFLAWVGLRAEFATRWLTY